MELPKGFEIDGSKIRVSLKLTETDVFEKFMRVCVEIFTDERIDRKVRKEYEDRFHKIIENWKV